MDTFWKIFRRFTRGASGICKQNWGTPERALRKPPTIYW